MWAIFSRPQCVNSIVRRPDKQIIPLLWRHNGHDSVSNHQPHECLLNCLFRRRSKKTSKLRVTGLCVGNSPGTGEFLAQMASNAENVSIWWRHHAASWNVAQGLELSLPSSSAFEKYQNDLTATWNWSILKVWTNYSPPPNAKNVNCLISWSCGWQYAPSFDTVP